MATVEQCSVCYHHWVKLRVWSTHTFTKAADIRTRGGMSWYIYAAQTRQYDNTIIYNYNTGISVHFVSRCSGRIFNKRKLGFAPSLGARALNKKTDGRRFITCNLWQKLLHFEWSPPWHHIDTYLSQILTFFVLKSGEDKKERIILMESRDLRPLDFIRIILSSLSLLLVRDPAVTTVIYLAKLIQTDSRYAWFQRISDRDA